ncbi:MAG TPA: MFS transporter [Actinocrinis sp.]|nr:MFS transporter [Actinocrinis sp.]
MSQSGDVAAGATTGRTIRTLIPARVDRLPWSGFHTRLVIALGVAWILDGLEITVASAMAGVLNTSSTLNMSSTAVGAIATVYLAGEVVGALVFGRLSDRLGRRKLFMITLGIYLVGSGLTALTFGAGTGWVLFLYFTRFVAGTGIGGEYAAINSAIGEMIPARHRGQVDIAVNGTYWAGAVLGTLGSLLFLNVVPEHLGWRLGFLLGPVLAVVILAVRRNLPESPRWQVMHDRPDEAEATIGEIEREVADSGREVTAVDEDQAMEITPQPPAGYLTLIKVLFSSYPGRSTLGATLMISQSFLYNSIFFTYTLVLTKFYGVKSNAAPWFLIAFAAGNLIGPFTLGRLFDTIGRKKMIAGTYLISGVLLAVTAQLFESGDLTALTQTLAWCVIFFFASSGASAAYLTVSEIFPLEVRAQAIAVFFAIAQGFGALGPVLYGHLIGDGHDPHKLFIGYLIGAGVMMVGGICEIVLGVSAEGKGLESIAKPLSAIRKTGSGLGAAMSGKTGTPPRPARADGLR